MSPRVCCNRADYWRPIRPGPSWHQTGEELERGCLSSPLYTWQQQEALVTPKNAIRITHATMASHLFLLSPNDQTLPLSSYVLKENESRLPRARRKNGSVRIAFTSVLALRKFHLYKLHPPPSHTGSPIEVGWHRTLGIGPLPVLDLI